MNFNQFFRFEMIATGSYERVISIINPYLSRNFYGVEREYVYFVLFINQINTFFLMSINFIFNF